MFVWLSCVLGQHFVEAVGVVARPLFKTFAADVCGVLVAVTESLTDINVGNEYAVLLSRQGRMSRCRILCICSFFMVAKVSQLGLMPNHFDAGIGKLVSRMPPSRGHGTRHEIDVTDRNRATRWAELHSAVIPF